MLEVFDRPTTSDLDRRRLSADERRAGILTAARAEFSRIGYHGTSTASIARAAGCSEPMLYKHFSSKHDLFVTTLRATIQVSEAYALKDEVLTADALERALAFTQGVMLDPEFQKIAKLRYLALGLAHDPEVRAVMSEIDAGISHRVTGMLSAAQRSGLIRQDVTAEYLMTMWQGLVLAACWHEGVAGDGFERTIPHLERFIRETFSMQSS